jgi:hypothetical protein
VTLHLGGIRISMVAHVCLYSPSSGNVLTSEGIRLEDLVVTLTTRAQDILHSPDIPV